MKRKLGQASSSCKKVKTHDKQDNTDPISNIFRESVFHIHSANFGVGRLKIFEKQVKKHGGKLVDLTSQSFESITHVVFEESVDLEDIKKLLDVDNYPNAVFVKCSWLSLCIKSKLKKPTKDYEIIVKPEKSLKTKLNADSPKFNDESLSHDDSRFKQNRDGEASCSSVKGCQLNPSDLQSNSNETEIEEVVTDFKNTDEKNVINTQHTLVPKISEIGVGDHYDVSLMEKSSEIPQIPGPSTSRKPFPKSLQEKFVCSQPSSTKVKGFNTHITSELEKLATAYKSKNDTWRAMGYQKAISAIRNYPKEITTREEALSIRGIGARLAEKVAEIIESGKLRKVAEVCEGEEVKCLELFMGVWGAGPTTAQSWYTQGFRTLDDLRTKATLSRHQQIGLKYYDDINSRIPRDEVVQIETFVRETAHKVKEGLIVNVCGSYRRGKPTCGDVDILITHPDGHSHENIFKPILQKLRDSGFLTDDLVMQEDNGNQQKYLGVCLLPGQNMKHRRLDVIVVPYKEFAPAIMYFTGSAHFNRSMRLLAIKMGMSLSEHGLRTGIIRQGREKLTAGHLLDTPTEESIFKHLGLDYRSPQERDH